MLGTEMLDLVDGGCPGVLCEQGVDIELGSGAGGHKRLQIVQGPEAAHLEEHGKPVLDILGQLPFRKVFDGLVLGVDQGDALELGQVCPEQTPVRLGTSAHRQGGALVVTAGQGLLPQLSELIQVEVGAGLQEVFAEEAAHLRLPS